MLTVCHPQALRLTQMPDARSRALLPEWAKAFAKCRNNAGLTQEELAFRSGVSQSLISQIERGVQHPTEILHSRLARIIRELNLTPRSFSELTGVDVSLFAGETDEKLQAMQYFRLAPIIGVAEAGQPNEYPVPTTIWRANTAVFEISGSSMTTSSPDSLRDGDIVFIDKGVLEPVEGKVFVAHQIGNGYVIKRARKLNGSWYFLSDNPDYPSLREEEIELCGMVYNAMGSRTF